MIRLTRETDYAIVLLVYLATTRGSALAAATYNARALADACRLRLPMVGKILKTLSRMGILASQRGSKGGYALARPAEEISVAEVVSAMEGPVAMTECTSDSAARTCAHEPFCGVRGNWQIINQALRQTLEALTLAEMARPLAPSDLVRLSTRKPGARSCSTSLEPA